ELATLHADCPIEFDQKLLKYRLHISDQCIDFLKSMDFHSLVAKWSGGAVPTTRIEVEGEAQVELIPVSEAPGKDVFRTINTEKDFQKLLEALEKSKEFGFDIESTSLNPRLAELVG